jgi:two-component system, OmpR family, response regulator MprA
MRVLLVERSSPQRGELERALLIAGTDVLVAGGGEEGLARVGADSPDVVVISSELADMDPLWVCRRLRESYDGVPVLVMSGADAVPDPISALNAGADDFMPRASGIGELHARLRALARRGANGSAPARLRFKELELDVGEHAARIGERVVRLTRTEFELLHLFMRNPRRVLPHELIYERVWGYDFALAGNTLRVYVGYLRRKLEAGGERRLLHTVRGVGYVLREP